MKEFEVKVQRKPNSPVLVWPIKAVSEEAAKAAAERLLKLRRAPSPKVISATEVKK